MEKDFGKLTTPIYTAGKTSAKIRKLNGFTMFTILFSLFILVLGVTAGLTYSGFQSTAESNGTLTFAVNGHHGTLNLTNTKVSEYDSTDLLLTFTLASDTNYTSPTISGITMNNVALTKDGNNFKNSSIIVATYSAPTLTINRANVSGDLVITGSSTAQTYTITYNSNGGTGTMANSVVNYGSTTTLRLNAFTRTGYAFAGWADSTGGDVEFGNGARIKDLANITLYAVWVANEITFDNQNKSLTYSTTSQTTTITSASNGTGTYTYDITAGNDDSYFSISSTTITAGANTPVGVYNLAVTATDSGSSKMRTSIISITINYITLGTPVVSVSTAGVVTWGAITGASSYDISIDGTTWTTGVSSGVNYFDSIVAGTGSRTVRVRANPSASYDASKIGTSAVTVYAVTIARNNNSYGTVSASSRNVISGATVSVSNNVLYFAGGQGVTPTATSATGYNTTFTSWSKTSGTITSAQTITATFTRTAKTYTVSSGKSSYTNTLTVAASGTFGSGLSISWAAGNETGYIYSLSHVKVYSGSNTSGTLLATYTSGTSATFTMSGTYYSSIYVYATHTRVLDAITINFTIGNKPNWISTTPYITYSIDGGDTSYYNIANGYSRITASDSNRQLSGLSGHYTLYMYVYAYVREVDLGGGMAIDDYSPDNLGTPSRYLNYSGDDCLRMYVINIADLTSNTFSIEYSYSYEELW